MRRVLVVSPRFPPVNAADMHRVRLSLPYLPELGWDPVVLAVEPSRCDHPLDLRLEETVRGVRVVRTSAMDAGKTRWLGFRNLELRSGTFLARRGTRLLSEEPFDLVYFSTTAFSVAALGPRWRERFCVPFVLDMQDPWFSEYYDQPGAPAPPGGRLRYGVMNRVARVLESYTMRRVSHVISVSPAYADTLQRRYPWMRPEQFSVIPFGAGERDFEVVGRGRVSQSVFDPGDGCEHWVYVGRGGPDMAFSLGVLFTALRKLRSEQPERAAKLRLHFIGTDYADPSRARKTVEPVAADFGVADMVEERTQRIPYFETLRCLLDADGLILPGSDDPGYTASKVYPYILARKPLVAVFHRQSTVVELLRRTNGGTVVTFGGGESREELADLLLRSALAGSRLHSHDVDWAAFEPYTAGALAKRQARVFDQVVAEQRGSRPARV